MKPRSVPPRRTRWWQRVPVAAWVIAVVAVGHGLFFWLVEDAHFMPKVSPYSPPPSPPNFGARKETVVDPSTGETTSETLFVVSTEFATPTPDAKQK